MAQFRVHFDDGEKLSADTPEQARKVAKLQNDSPIVKIKLIKGDA